MVANAHASGNTMKKYKCQWGEVRAGSTPSSQFSVI